jgi:hypothetical protein
VQYTQIIDVAYGRAVLAKLYHEDRPASLAWMLVHKTHEPLFVTFIASNPLVREDAMQIVETLAPGRFSISLAIAADHAAPGLASHALLVGDGTVTTMNLANLPQPIWDDACRHARASSNAEVVVQVLAGQERGGGAEVAVIYAESKDRHRRVVVRDGITHEIDAPDRLDLFRACDPRLASVLVQAART